MKNVKRYFQTQAESYRKKSSRGLLGRLRQIESRCFDRFISDQSFQHVLDLGSGAGCYTQKVLSVPYKPSVTAIDCSEKMLAQIDDPKLTKICGDMRDVKSLVGRDSSKFDLAMCMGALEFLPSSDRSVLFTDVASVLRPNGKFCLLFPLFGVASFLYFFFHLSHGVFVRLPFKSTLRKELEKSGFRVKKSIKIWPLAIFMEAQVERES